MYSEKQLIRRIKKIIPTQQIPEGYWLCGVRSADDKPDAFDDYIYLMKKDKIVLETSITTNPGVKILKRGFLKYNKKGAAILQADCWHNDCWKYGKHKGIVPALKQTGNEVSITRDNNMNSKSEVFGKVYFGYFGINFHSASKDFMSNLFKTIVGGWSAGCQVANNLSEYREIINICKNSEQEKFSYCLLNEFSI